MSNPKTRYLVTGGAGFIGGHLVDRLLADGHSVAVLDDFSTGKRENIERFSGRIDFVEGSLNSTVACDEAVRGAEFVLHQAAIASVPRSVRDPLRSHEANITGTLNLLEACRRHKIRRIVYAASSSAYGNQDAAVKTEDLLPGPLSPYAVTKLTCEHYLAAYTECYALETVSLRYFNVFGPRQDPKSEYAAVIPRFITAMLKGERPTIYGNGQQTRDFTYVDNNVNANLLACHAPAASGQMMNVACGTSYSLLDLVDAINKVLGTSIQPIFEPARTGDVMHSLADVSRAKKLIGYGVTVGFEEGLKRTVGWYGGNRC